MTVFFSRLPHGGTKKDNLRTGYLETTYCLEKIAKLYSQIHHYLWKCYISNFRTGYTETTFCWEIIAKFYSQIHQYLWKCYHFNFLTGYLEMTYCQEKIAKFYCGEKISISIYQCATFLYRIVSLSFAHLTSYQIYVFRIFAGVSFSLNVHL